jgi:LacI family transcriptional regulator
VRYVVETRSADAVILNQTLPQDPRIQYLQAKGFPFATHGRTRLEKPHPYFDFDNVAFGKIAIGRLVQRGCRKIVLIGPPPEHTYGDHMRLGVMQAAQAAGIEVLDMSDITSDSMSDDVLRVMHKVLAEDGLVDGVISASPGAAMAAVAAIESVGRTLGQGIHLVSKEAIPFLGLFRKEIITIREDVGRAGIFLSKAAIQAIQSPHEPPLQGLDVPTDNGT